MKMFVDYFEEQCCKPEDKALVAYYATRIRNMFKKDSKVAREKHRMDTVIEIENMFRKLCDRHGSQCKLKEKYDRAPVTVNEVLHWFVLRCANDDQREAWERCCHYRKEERSNGDEKFQEWLDLVEEFLKFQGLSKLDYRYFAELNEAEGLEDASGLSDLLEPSPRFGTCSVCARSRLVCVCVCLCKTETESSRARARESDIAYD
jgi:hypothetical protein